MFIVLNVVAPPQHLTGYLSRFLTEVTTGLYVGKLSTRVAKGVWERVQQVDVQATIVASTGNEQGYFVRFHNIEGRSVVSLDGLELIARTQQAR